jgi:predicted nucleic acid-binding protein
VWVLDTNVVLDLLHFDDAAARPLLGALENGRVHAAVTDATLEELRRVLAYPEFNLDDARQAAIFARYESLSRPQASIGPGADLSHKGTQIHYGLKPMWSRMTHKGTPIHYGLKPMWSRMPRCSDPDDQKFLELAAASRAQLLVSKDRALLKLRRRCASLFQVLTPVEAVHWLHGISRAGATET